MSIPMKTQTTPASAKINNRGEVAEISLSILVATADIDNVAQALEGFAALVPSCGAEELTRKRGSLLKVWPEKYKNKRHEIKVITAENEKVLNVVQEVVEASPARRFNKFGEEVASLEDIFPDKHPGLVLKGFRQRDNLTQQELADLLQITQSRVSALESGTRAISKLMATKLGKIFAVPHRVFL